MTDPAPEQIAAAKAAEALLFEQAIRSHFEQRTLTLRVERDALAARVADLESQIADLTAPEAKEAD